MQRAPCPRTDAESQGGVSPRKPGRVPTGPSVPANATSLSSMRSVTLGCRPPLRSAADQVLLHTYLRRSHNLTRQAWTTRTATVRRPARAGASAGRAVAKPAPSGALRSTMSPTPRTRRRSPATGVSRWAIAHVSGFKSPLGRRHEPAVLRALGVVLPCGPVRRRGHRLRSSPAGVALRRLHP
jgi:hypothetical protein